MKCKTFKIHLLEETGSFEEAKLDKFLENLNVEQIFSSIVNNEYWSVLVFYNDNTAAHSNKSGKPTNIAEENPTAKLAERMPKAESVPAEPIILTADEEKIYALLRGWRNETAARDGLAPYMIAHNDSLMLIAKIAKNNPQTLEELVQIKGFGEKRAQKYGDEILQIIASAKSAQAE